MRAVLTDRTRGDLLKLGVIALLAIALGGSLLIASGVTRPDGGRAFIPAALPLTLPQTAVRVEAAFVTAAPWGVQIGGYAILLHPDGYVSVGTGAEAPRWLEFPHVRRGNNTLLLIAAGDGVDVFVNDERVTRLSTIRMDLSTAAASTITGIDLPAGAVISRQPPG